MAPLGGRPGAGAPPLGGRPGGGEVACFLVGLRSGRLGAGAGEGAVKEEEGEGMVGKMSSVSS